MPASREDGFTVIELMIAIMIMLIITVPLVASFVIGIQTTLGSQQDVTNSADAQLLGFYFDIDVASAESASPTSTCGGGGSVLELTWTDVGSTVVAYRAVADPTRTAELQLPPANPVYRLERVRCVGASSIVTVLARTLTQVPVATCDAAACTAGQKPRRIALQVQERSTQESDVGSSDTFSFGVTAARKVTP